MRAFQAHSLQYPNYRETGIPYIGDLPDHWEIHRGTFVFKVIDERSKTGTEELLSVTEGSGVKPRSESNVNMFLAASYQGYKLCYPGDLVINSLWAWGRGLGISKYKGIVSTAYSVYRPNYENYDKNYLNYLLRNTNYVSQYLIESKGIWISRLQLSDWAFLRLQIISPPKSEQTAIARFLDEKTALIDKAISIKERQIELLKERRDALINKAVTKGLNPKVKMKDSGVEWIGQIPEHWEVKKLKYSAYITYGISPHEKTYNVDGSGTILVNGPAEYSDSEFGFTRAIKWTTAPVKFAKKGSLLFCLRGSTTGRLNICHDNLSIGRGCAAIQSKTNQNFLIIVMQALTKQISQTFKGSTFASVTSSDLDNYYIALPPVEEQIKIANSIEKIQHQTSLALSLKADIIDKLKECKISLINSAVTGKVKVC